MCIKLEENKSILSERYLWYEGNTSCIYKFNDLLYKLSLRNEPNKSEIIDELVNNKSLRNVGILPIDKFKTNSNRYGCIVKYLEGATTLEQYLNNNYNVDELIDIFILLSNNLKIVNNEHIKFSDLHLKNVLIDSNKYPWYIDFDDAVVNDYSSKHISVIAYNLHELYTKKVTKKYTIKYKNLDREALFIMFMDSILGIKLERLSFFDYMKLLDRLSLYLPSYFIDVLECLKKYAIEDGFFEYYLGDYLVNSDVKDSCKVLSRFNYKIIK